MTDSALSTQHAALLEDLFRRQAARIVAALTRYLGPQHLALAEDALQETFITALRSWSYRGVPDNPPAWLMTVARNKALDVVRRERELLVKQGELAREAELHARAGELEQAVEWLDDDLRDDQLRMIFTCCHPALAREAQVALTLKLLCGLGVPEIARAFLVPESTIAQRLVRAVPFGVPDAAELPARLDAVLDVLYLLFNEGYSAHRGDDLVRPDLCAEAIRLASILAAHPAGARPKVHALLALMLLHASRLPARTDARGNLLLLEEQDRARWDRRLILAGLRELSRAAAGDEVSAYHLQAGIAACHAVAPDYAATNWRQILSSYDDLLALEPSPVVALNRAVALAMVAGPEAGIAELERVGAMPGMQSYYLLHMTAGEFFRRTGDIRRALEHYRRAERLPATAPERRFLARRLAECAARDG
jgi:RNA polymerase sigma-70 factor (ECF subfamily)